MWYLNLFQQLRIYQQCMAMWIRKLWSHIKFWDAPSFQTYSLMWVPWICSPKSPGFQPSHLWGFYKSSLFLSCFHPQRHSRSSSSPGTVVLSCRDGQSFHQPRRYWSQTKTGAIQPSIIETWIWGYDANLSVLGTNYEYVLMCCCMYLGCRDYDEKSGR